MDPTSVGSTSATSAKSHDGEFRYPRGMSIIVEVSNLGPLRTARVEIADMNLLIGENNTGKTFFATVLHRVLDAPFSIHWPWKRDVEEAPEQLQQWIHTILDASMDSGKLPALPPLEPNDNTLAWSNRLLTSTLQDFGIAVRNSIEYAFGADASDLRRRTAKKRSPDCYLVVENTELKWRAEIRFDSEDVRVETPDAMTWLRGFLTESAVDWSLRSHPFFHRSVDDLDEYREIFYRHLVYGEGRSLLFRDWPLRSVHLPAERSGLLQSYQVLAGASFRHSTFSRTRPIEIEPLPGTAADFLSLMLSLYGEKQRAREDDDRRFDDIISSFEDQLRAVLDIDTRAGYAESIVANTPEGSFPLSRSSSTISEIAPLLLVLKTLDLKVDLFTIDEPEAHLHPRMQLDIADLLANLASAGMRVIVTTHSDYIIGRINNMLRRCELAKSQDDATGSGIAELKRSQLRVVEFARDGDGRRSRGIEAQVDRIDAVDESTFTDVMELLYDESAELVSRLLHYRDN